MQPAIRRAVSAAGRLPLRTWAAFNRVVAGRTYNTPRSICTKQMRFNESVQPVIPPFARVFAFPFGLHDHDALLSEYRSCTDVETAKALLKDMQSLVATESHALDLESHLLSKSAQGNDSSSDVYLELASRVELWSATIQRVALDLQVEQIRKEFVLYPPSTAADADPGALSPAGVRFNVEWSTSRHTSRQELSPFAYHMRVVATPFKLEVAASEGDSPLPERVDLAPVVVMDVSEADNTRVDTAAIDSLRTEFAGPAVNQRQWAWFLAFMSTHPTDLAFDVVSECLLRDPKER